MASTAAKLIAVIGSDTKGLDRGLARSDRKLKGFAKGGTAAMAGVGRAASSLGAVAGVALPASIAVGAGAAIVSIGKMGIAYNSLKEQAEIAFTTMLGSGEAAREMLADLETFAAKTPFEFEKLLPQSQQLKAFGFEAKRIIPMLTTIGDAVSGLGGGGEKIRRVTLALGQMQAKGKVAAQELMQLTEAGIPAWQYLADTLNTDVAGAMKLVEQRSVDAGVAISGILAGMDTDFGGMMEQQAQTLEGAWSTIKDTAKQIAGEITEPVFDALRDEMVKFATDTLPEFQEYVKRSMAGWEKAGIAVDQFLILKGPSNRNVMAQDELEATKEAIEDITAMIEAGDDPTGYWATELERLTEQLNKSEKAAADAAEAYRIAGLEAAFVGGQIDTWVTGARNIGVYEPTWAGVGPDTERLKHDAAVKAEAESDRRVRILLYEQSQEAERLNARVADQYEKDLQRAIEDAHRKARSRVEGILFTPSQVTKEDMFRSTPAGAELFGAYEDKPDEYVRRLEAAAQDANSEWRKLLIPADVLAAGEDAIRIYVDKQSDLFRSGMLPEQYTEGFWDAVANEFQAQAQQEAAKGAWVEQAMGELAKRGITAAQADVEAMVKPGAGAAKTMTEEFKKGLEDQSPVTLLLDQINTEMTAKSEDIKKAGTTFFETFLGGIDETKETTVSWLIQILLPGLVSELEYQGYVGGENP